MSEVLRGTIDLESIVLIQNQTPRLAVKLSHIYTKRRTTKHHNTAAGTAAITTAEQQVIGTTCIPPLSALLLITIVPI